MLASTRTMDTARIASLNDQLRSNPAAYGHVLFTAGVMRLIDRETSRRIAAVVMGSNSSSGLPA